MLHKELDTLAMIVEHESTRIEGYEDTVDAQEILYLSGDVKVKGYILKPVEHDDPLPCIVFNRGGNRDFGIVSPDLLRYLASLVSQGYVVMASQYRGCAGGEGRDEFGGSDLTDVLTLLELADCLSFVDSRRKFLYGGSRGGMMTYMAIRAGADVCAAAVICGATDLFAAADERSEMYTHVLKPLIGELPEARNEYIKRSAVYWADEISVPVLIIHGEVDDRVDVRQAKQLAEKLALAGREHRLMLLPDVGHNILVKSSEINKELLAWFKQHSPA